MPRHRWSKAALAAAAHAGDRHDVDSEPFIDHALAVAELVCAAGYGEHVVVAALLHDVGEHTDLSIQTVEERLGGEIAELVAALTEPHEGPQAARKAAHRAQIADAGLEAQAIFVPTRSRSRALRRGLQHLGADELNRRLRTPLAARLDHHRATLTCLSRSATSCPSCRHCAWNWPASNAS